MARLALFWVAVGIKIGSACWLSRCVAAAGRPGPRGGPTLVLQSALQGWKKPAATQASQRPPGRVGATGGATGGVAAAVAEAATATATSGSKANTRFRYCGRAGPPCVQHAPGGGWRLTPNANARVAGTAGTPPCPTPLPCSISLNDLAPHFWRHRQTAAHQACRRNDACSSSSCRNSSPAAPAPPAVTRTVRKVGRWASSRPPQWPQRPRAGPSAASTMAEKSGRWMWRPRPASAVRSTTRARSPCAAGW
jgi:hypothetical protein